MAALDCSTQFHHFTHPFVQWHGMPTFVVGEYLFFVLAMIAFIHAKKNGAFPMLVWWASLFAGTVNDLLFMYLPLADNFWHAQATMMISARLPAYIPCVYICFLYFPTFAAKRWTLPPLATGMLVGLLAWLFYSAYDVVGVRFMWWTWHTSDVSLQQRVLGVPVSSSLWVLSFAASFYWVLEGCAQYIKGRGIKKTLVKLIMISVLTPPLMILQISFFQLLSGQKIISIWVLLTALLVYCTIIGLSKLYLPQAPNNLLYNRGNSLVSVSLIIYFLSLAAIIMVGDPQKHVSVGIHQPYGPCPITSTETSDPIRRIYLCKADVDKNFSLDCHMGAPLDFTNWYAICGKNTADDADLKWGLCLLCCLGIIIYAVSYSTRSSRTQRSK